MMWFCLLDAFIIIIVLYVFVKFSEFIRECRTGCEYQRQYLILDNTKTLDPAPYSTHSLPWTGFNREAQQASTRLYCGSLHRSMHRHWGHTTVWRHASHAHNASPTTCPMRVALLPPPDARLIPHSSAHTFVTPLPGTHTGAKAASSFDHVAHEVSPPAGRGPAGGGRGACPRRRCTNKGGAYPSQAEQGPHPEGEAQEEVHEVLPQSLAQEDRQ